jgi:hypothetical protein
MIKLRRQVRSNRSIDTATWPPCPDQPLDTLLRQSMITSRTSRQQRKLDQHQIEEFYVDCFAQEQARAFAALVPNQAADLKSVVVDVGGGCGYFARDLAVLTGARVRVIDSDPRSVAACSKHGLAQIEAIVGDALNPQIRGDEQVACFNLILHHLVGNSEGTTRSLQKQALMAWKGKVARVFVSEYIYESYVGNASGRLMYEITRSALLSRIGKLISKIIPAFRANTFGVGVRFRAHQEWIDLFNECGFEVISRQYGEPDPTALPRRALLIRQARRDSFVLKAV